MINDNIKDSYSTGLADPFIYRFDGDYYLLFTAPKGLKAFKSHDLVAFEEVDNGVNARGFVAEDEKLVAAYAPELIHFNGYFYIITSMGGNGHHILRAKSIIGPYEFITGNIHESIDGSFFINDDEEIYVTRASETGIALNKLEPDFTKFKLNEYGVIDSLTFEEARTFGWTEGPYILKRYGKYYLTYTGTHFLSDAYRVNYAVADNLNDPKSFKFMDTIIMSLKDDFYGLGHSATFLGPNLDSYFIVYHDMNPNRVRTANISRLLFSKNLMTVNDVNVDLHPNIEMPDFETRSKKDLIAHDDKYFYVNPYSSRYSFEINFKGENEKIYFGYIDEKNHFYAGFAGNLLEIHNVNGESDTLIYKKNFKYTYLKESIKTLRIQILKSKMVLYFNNIELGFNIDLLKDANGDIGFDKNLELTFLAVSKYSYGNSDNEEIKLGRVLASNFEGSSLTHKCNFRSDFVDIKNKSNLKYNVYVEESGDYYLDMNIKSPNKTFVMDVISNGSAKSVEVELLNNEEYKNICVVHLEKGINTIELSSNDNFSFSYFDLEKICGNCRDIVENLSSESSYLTHIGRPIFTPGGLYFDNDRNFSYVDDVYENFDVQVNLCLRGNPIDEDRFAALVVLNKKYGKRNQFECAYSLDGIIFGFNAKSIFILENDFDKTKVLKKADMNNNLNRLLRVIKEKNKISFYVNELLFYSHDITHGNLRGKIGLYNVHASIYFKNLFIKKGENL